MDVWDTLFTPCVLGGNDDEPHCASFYLLSWWVHSLLIHVIHFWDISRYSLIIASWFLFHLITSEILSEEFLFLECWTLWEEFFLPLFSLSLFGSTLWDMFSTVFERFSWTFTFWVSYFKFLALFLVLRIFFSYSILFLFYRCSISSFWGCWHFLMPVALSLFAILFMLFYWQGRPKGREGFELQIPLSSPISYPGFW